MVKNEEPKKVGETTDSTRAWASALAAQGAGTPCIGYGGVVPCLQELRMLEGPVRQV
jgi:hypothetical protein